MAHAMPKIAHRLKIMHALSTMLFLLQWGCVARELVSRFRAGLTPENGVYVQYEGKWLSRNSHTRDGTCVTQTACLPTAMQAILTMFLLLRCGCAPHEIVSRFLSGFTPENGVNVPNEVKCCCRTRTYAMSHAMPETAHQLNIMSVLSTTLF